VSGASLASSTHAAASSEQNESEVMVGSALTASEEAQLTQTIEMFEVITQSQPQDYQSLEILKEAYHKLGRASDVISVSKRIAKAYVMMGQISSAILEYESVLQRCPDDAEVLTALGELESKTHNLNAAQDADVAKTQTAMFRKRASFETRLSTIEFDDGRQMMRKIFVDSKVIAPTDFDMCWSQPDLDAPPDRIIDPFVQSLADKSVLPLEKSLKIISDKHRIGFLPLERYDVDTELARSFPIETCWRWCVLPFDRMSKSVLVATANPFNKQAAHELEVASKQRFIWYLASPPDLVRALRKVFR
jgi:hypothetical protein